MGYLVNLLCTILIASMELLGNVSGINPSTYEDIHKHGNRNSSTFSLDPYGTRVHISETHEMGSDGVWIPKSFNYKKRDNKKILLVVFIYITVLLALLVFFYKLFIMPARRNNNIISSKSGNKPLDMKSASNGKITDIHPHNSYSIKNINKVSSSIDGLTRQTNIPEKVTTFIRTITQKGINNFSIERLSDNQRLEIFLFDVCMIKNILLVKGKIENIHIPIIDEKINIMYKNIKSRYGFKTYEFSPEANDLIEIRSPFYIKDIEGILTCDYPRTKMYMPYSLYFFIYVAPFDTVCDMEDAVEEIMRCQSNKKILGSVFDFMKAFESHYNWLVDQIDSF